MTAMVLCCVNAVVLCCMDAVAFCCMNVVVFCWMNAVMLRCMIAIVLCCVNAVVLCCMNAVAALKSPEQLSVSNKGIQRIQGPRHMNVLKNTKGQRQSVVPCRKERIGRICRVKRAAPEGTPDKEAQSRSKMPSTAFPPYKP